MRQANKEADGSAGFHRQASKLRTDRRFFAGLVWWPRRASGARIPNFEGWFGSDPMLHHMSSALLLGQFGGFGLPDWWRFRFCLFAEVQSSNVGAVFHRHPICCVPFWIFYPAHDREIQSASGHRMVGRKPLSLPFHQRGVPRLFVEIGSQSACSSAAAPIEWA